MTTEQFKQQILPFHAMMYGVAKAILESEDDACDAVQDSMMSLWQKRDSLPSVANLRAYCAAAVRNQCMTMVRERAAHRQESLEVAPAVVDDSTEKRVDDADAIARLSNVIDRLPASQAEVMRLSAFGGLSNDEIAQATGLDNQNVRTLLSRGRRKIKEMFIKLNR